MLNVTNKSAQFTYLKPIESVIPYVTRQLLANRHFTDRPTEHTYTKYKVQYDPFG